MNETIALTAAILGIIAICAGFYGFGVNIGKVGANLDKNTEVLTEVYKITVKQDDRIQDVENNKAEKTDVILIDKRLTIMETNCKHNHKE